MYLDETIRDWVVEFKAPRGESPRKSLYVSENAASALSKALQKQGQKFIELHDDTGNFIELLDKQEIKGVRRSGDIERDVERFVVCEYGTRHPHLGKRGFEDCRCCDRFKVPPLQFYRVVREKYPEVDYDHDITPEMQNGLERLAKAFYGTMNP